MPEQILDDFHLGIDADLTDPDAKPYGQRVLWIRWDSGFRGSALRIGDLVTAIDGHVFDTATLRFDLGQYGEERFWADAGARDGQEVVLSVVRDGDEQDIEGTLRAERLYSSDSGRRALASAGPEAMERDGFDEAWAFWDERLVRDLQTALQVGWRRNTRQQLGALLEDAPRIAFLVQRYPGPYANAMKDDFDRTVEFLKGTRYDLGSEDLAYRALTESRLQRMIALALEAHRAFLSRVDAVELGALPEVDPVRGDRKAVTGAVVRLDAVEEIVEAGHGWFVARGAGRSIYLMDSYSPGFHVIAEAVYRFRQVVSPSLNDIYRLVGRVSDRPAMVVSDRRIYTGIVIDPLAALVDGKMFIDASGGDGSRYAGEAETRPPRGDADADAAPEEVFRSFVDALKENDLERWLGFFAAWRCREQDGTWVVDPEGGSPSRRQADYEGARRCILGPVYDLRVAKRSKPVVLTNRPVKVEQVEFVVDHVGLFDGEYRAFNDVDVHRDWTLQRLDGGPWRITSEQGI